MCLLVAYSYQVWFLPINVGFIVIEMFWLMYVAVVYTVRPARLQTMLSTMLDGTGVTSRRQWLF